MSNLYPVLMAPWFQHGSETPWGGHMLRDIIMKDAPDDAVGASFEVSTQPGRESLVANGIHAGKSLTRLVELWGEQLTGCQGDEFPFLLKLLDAEQPLSVQVHPDDAYAQAHEHMRGKSLAWIILNAEPGAKLVYGLDGSDFDLRSAIEDETLEAHLNWEKARVSDVFYVPSGMVHALGSGILCYEIQQASDAAYRIWDWGRGRELHIDRALDVCDPKLKLDRIEGTTVLCKGGSRTYYISDDHFEMCRLNLSGKMPVSDGRMLLLTALGPCAIHWEDGTLELKPFDTAIIPAALEGAVLEGNTKVMMSSLPNRPALIEALGYRAENVPGLLK